MFQFNSFFFLIVFCLCMYIINGLFQILYSSTAGLEWVFQKRAKKKKVLDLSCKDSTQQECCNCLTSFHTRAIHFVYDKLPWCNEQEDIINWIIVYVILGVQWSQTTRCMLRLILVCNVSDSGCLLVKSAQVWGASLENCTKVLSRPKIVIEFVIEGEESELKSQIKYADSAREGVGRDKERFCMEKSWYFLFISPYTG